MYSACTRFCHARLSGADTRRRAIENSGKPRMHVIDLVDNCGKHKVRAEGKEDLQQAKFPHQHSKTQFVSLPLVRETLVVGEEIGGVVLV